jgi:hypothetical protein
VTCPHCSSDVRRAPFCVRCGEPLENRESPYPHETRGFAAAPHQRLLSPRIVSSLFPHLPRAEMIAFEAILAAGAGAIVLLCLLDLYPLALIAAAALVPFLVVLYLWSVQLYEDAPLPMIAFTVVWGGVAGVGLGLASRSLTSSLDLLTERTSTRTVLLTGVALPLATVVVTIAGPLVLLGYRRFDDVLDGATFGGACGVACLGAETITNSAPFLGGGLRAPGSATLWTVRLLTLGVAVPVLAAGAIGAACAAFWLRYRCSLRDRGALGRLGSPPVAVAAAAVDLVGVDLSQIYLGRWSTLAIAAALAALALVSLRRAVHLGLREEAAELEVGEAVRCPNCRRDTPHHHFCAHCGVALRALPKAGPAGERPYPSPLRISRNALPVLFGLALGGAVAVSVVAILQTRPAPVRPPCTSGSPCGIPPVGPPLFPTGHLSLGAAAFQDGTRWTSAAGVALRYDSQIWSPFVDTSQRLFLKAENSSTGLFVVAGVIVEPSSVSGTALLNQELANDGKGFLGLGLDTSRDHVLLGPAIGTVAASGSMYTATVDAPPSPSVRVELAFELATSGGATVLVEAITDEQPTGDSNKASSPFPAFALVDEILDTLTWPSPV